ncbi:uncharacterized protein LOC132302320 [Cornus florida]|uniref:uncharacterized protein LOC132302320 n=1 Tax=Cornus florida TaxID=4283 RepID=UPI002898D244|nr:uncharacterized protein LOC132302320 [Cornus florida]
MDGRGGCCIARCAGGGGAAAYDMSKVDRIMLRFRPIAPKPATSGSVSGGSPPGNNEVYVRSGRCKRRYVKDSNNRRSYHNRKRKASSEETDKTTSGGSDSSGDTVVTLPLSPEIPDRKVSPARKSGPMWLSFNNHGVMDDDDNDNDDRVVVGKGLDRTAVVAPRPVRVVGTVVTVECVTDTWVEGDGLGCTDEERMMNLERDTCPGFVSDGLDLVGWANGAYKDMVGQGGGGEAVVVWLVMKERVPVGFPAFTCRVRLQMEKRSLTLPCDVWRMDGGGCAWRLDVKAALSLGR